MKQSKFTRLGFKMNTPKSQRVLRKRFNKVIGREEIKLFKELNPDLFDLLHRKMCELHRRQGQSYVGGKLKAVHLFDFLYPDHVKECLHCRKEVSWAEDKKTYREFCSNACVNASTITLNRRRSTNVERYGTTEPNNNPIIKGKKITAFRKNYGVDNPSQSEVVQNRKRATCMERYGVTHHSKAGMCGFTIANPMKREEIKAKHRATMLDRYGVEYGPQLQEVQNKMRATCLKRHGYLNSFMDRDLVVNSWIDKLGVDHPMRSRAVRKEARARSIKKYGVPYPMQHPDIISKNFNSSKLKKPVTILGKDLQVRGCEDIVLKSIEPLIKNITIMAKRIPRILYRYKGQEHYYFPDAKVRTLKGTIRVVEAKSLYTLERYPKNTPKFRAATRACRNLGFEFWVAVATRQGIVWTKNPTSIRQVSTKVRNYLLEARHLQ